ncbi:RNA polymerase sigma factor [Bacteroidota bacterium]
MEKLSDEYIMEKVKQGNLDYLSILFERYNNQVLNYFFRMSSNYEDSRDLAQSLFFRILKYKKSFRQNMVFKYWLYKMAKNIFNDYFNKKQKYFNNPIYISVKQHSDYNDSDHVEKDRLLFTAISKLPTEYMELVILSKFCKYKNVELAEIYDTTIASIKNKLYRALIKLKELYFENALNN